ncbi:hypothetical protein [Flavobacterium tyrosinilyticum]|uniref:hypothetical protein n=1 Tax=Flavobacterium tyrosinilyticum TaxID=1658740 RepID=UPI00202F9326|nr:hypothetical protein [Flavobacterium tyrosinilyticum]MCM0666812.1 hypothetical protein [Flavobacterium tyrosinilyticum]
MGEAILKEILKTTQFCSESGKYKSLFILILNKIQINYFHEKIIQNRFSIAVFLNAKYYFFNRKARKVFCLGFLKKRKVRKALSKNFANLA